MGKPCESCDGSGVDLYDGGAGRDCQVCNGRGSVPDPTDAEVEAVARAMAGANWKPFDPAIHGSPVNQRAAQAMWLSHARAAIIALDEVRGQ